MRAVPERNIRKWFVDRDLIDGVILLPENLFYNTGAPGVIVVLNKRKPATRKNKIVLVNASQRVEKGRPKNFIPEGAVRPIAAAFAKGEPVEGEIAVITSEQAKAADYNLSPTRWIGSLAKSTSGDLPDLLAKIADLSRDKELLQEKLVASLRPLLAKKTKKSSESQAESQFGLTPADWLIRRIGDFTTQTQYGLSIRGERQGKYPILRMNCQEDGKVLLAALAAEKEAAAKAAKETGLPPKAFGVFWALKDDGALKKSGCSCAGCRKGS